ncbi:phosphatase PAP2 family protein [Patescibacteria group bacterium]|nr:phosphatase PAP2 family protein [Patescibacteria group bacterium]
MKLAVLWLIDLAAFIWLTVTVNSGATLGWDLSIGRAVQKYTFLSAPSYAVMYSGWAPWLFLWLGAVLLALILTRKWRAIVFLLLLSILDVVGFLFHITIINRPRPTPAQLHVFFPLPLSSYPSGHVLLTSLVFIFVAAVYRKRWVTLLAIIIMAAVGLGRIYSGQHFPTDILGGYLLAGVVIIPVIALYRSRKLFFHED